MKDGSAFIFNEQERSLAFPSVGYMFVQILLPVNVWPENSKSRSKDSQMSQRHRLWPYFTPHNVMEEMQLMVNVWRTAETCLYKGGLPRTAKIIATLLLAEICSLSHLSFCPLKTLLTSRSWATMAIGTPAGTTSR